MAGAAGNGLVLRDDVDAVAIAVVQRQVDAFNDKDITAFAACYAEGARIYRPCQAEAPFLVGRPAIIAAYGPKMLNEPDVRVIIEQRQCHDGIVTDVEYFPDTGRRATLVFKVGDGLIQQSWVYVV